MKIKALYYLSLVAIAGLVGGMSLIKTGQNVSYGTQLSALQKQLATLQQSKLLAEKKLAQTSTLGSVATRAKNSGFESASAPIAVITQHTVATLP
jgi:hypothetical protein